MSNVLGIVAEYNPFHNGHRYQLQAAKQQAGAELTVVVMSGNWVQRGEPSILDKWQRTNLALADGVDLVVELPFLFAVQPAHLFAQGAIELLHQLGVTTVAFGAEHPKLDFERLAANQPTHEKAHFKQFDETYPTLFNDYLQAQTGINLRSSNDILGFSYVTANNALGQPMRMMPIQRKGSSHQSLQVASGSVASGASIREALNHQDWTTVHRIVPEATYHTLKQAQLVNWSQYWPFLKYQLLTQPISQLQTIYQMSEGIEYRLKEAAKTATDFDTFLKYAKTKRFTYTRLQRLCVYILLQVDRLRQPASVRYGRVLGFNDKGRAHLSQIKQTATVPLITRVTQDWITGPYEMDYQAGSLRQMISGEDQDQLRHPVIWSAPNTSRQ